MLNEIIIIKVAFRFDFPVATASSIVCIFSGAHEAFVVVVVLGF